MMKITNRLDAPKIVCIIIFLVLLCWLLLPGPGGSHNHNRHVHTHAHEEKLEQVKSDVSEMHKVVDVDTSEEKIRTLEKKIREITSREFETVQKLKDAQKELIEKNKVANEEIKTLNNQLSNRKERLRGDNEEMDMTIKEISASSDKLRQENAELHQNLSSLSSLTKTTTVSFKGLKIVHFDLKGAPPKINYLLDVIKYAKKLGANGFLIEYEDMFPWRGELKILASKNAYTVEEIKLILKTAQDENLILIPLVQTFGHLEFVLKHKKFAHLRENKEIINSVCPLNNGSVLLIQKMLDQVLELHSDSNWIHLGGDEVWNINTCGKCQSSNSTNMALFMRHMIPLFKYVTAKESTNGKVKAIIWDDMMRQWNVKQLKRMAKFVSPMVWAYVANLDNYHHFPVDIWDRYSGAFKNIWLASSFKGALKPWSNFVPIKQHLDNHLSWLKITSRLQAKGTRVTGITLTGWSRFDHYGPLCELLPAGIPSLALCLSVLSHGSFSSSLHESVSKMLGFNSTFQIHITYFKIYIAELGQFQGADVYKLVGELENAIGWKEWSNVHEIGFTRPYQIKQNHLSFFHLNTTKNGISESIKLLTKIKKNAADILAPYFLPDTINEWISDKIDYYIDINKSSLKHIDDIVKEAHFS